MICKQCSHELPEPAPDFCPYCGIALSDNTPVSPDTTISFNNQSGYYCPWEDRQNLGFLNALWLTIKSVITQPTEFFKKLSPNGNFGSAIGFAVICGTISAIFVRIWMIPVQIMFILPMISRNPGTATISVASQFLSFFLGIILAPIGVLFGLFIGAALVHFFLWLVGGATKGFEATVRLISYSMAVSVLNVIPVLGWIISPIYTMVVEIIGLTEVHHTTFGKAIAARLLPMLLCCCCVAILGFVFAGFIMSMVQNPDTLKHLFEKFQNP